MVYRPINHAECWKNCFDSIGKVSYHCSIWLQRFGIRSFQYCTWKLYSSVHNKTQLQSEPEVASRTSRFSCLASNFSFLLAQWERAHASLLPTIKKDLTTWCSHIESTQKVVTWNWTDDFYCIFNISFVRNFHVLIWIKSWRCIMGFCCLKVMTP